MISDEPEKVPGAPETEPDMVDDLPPTRKFCSNTPDVKYEVTYFILGVFVFGGLV